MTNEEAKEYIIPAIRKMWNDKICDEIIKALEQDSVLDKIRAEIEALPKTYPFVNHIDMYVKEDDVKKIIDKYKANKHETKPNIKALGEDMRICQKSITDEKVLIGFNMAVAICNKHLAESEE